MKSYGLVLALLYAQVAVAAAPTDEQLAFFEKKIRPILVGHCYACHSADTKPAGGLRVDDHNGIMRGGESGPVVIPGAPEKSVLIQRISEQNSKRRMPKESEALKAEEIADLTTWIKDGAAWPEERVTMNLTHTSPAYDRLRARHWSLQPLTHVEAPAVSDKSWPVEEMDRFVLAKLEAKKLHPVTDASRATLIRRLTYDLTGLPPTPAAVDAFLKDKAADAYSRLVEGLLQWPQFGERWGRHWLDVARYGESTGPSRNIPYPHAWRYRDYVIDAFNRDVPFDRFIQEQVAGDLLPASDAKARDRLLIATGFLALGPKDVNQRFQERFIMDNVDEQIDTVTRSVLAMTASCARCHDHKFDPIPTADYYALAGIFTSTDNCAGLRNKMGGAGLDYYDPKMLVKLASASPVVPADEVAKVEAELASAKKAWEQITDTPEGASLGEDGKPKQQSYRARYESLQVALLALNDPGTRGYAVHGLREGSAIGDTAVRVRGEAERMGPTVPRGVLTVFSSLKPPPIDPTHSGRLELAQWLTSPENPLTPRVIVNRVWGQLFGQALVTTVDNFGLTGDRPSHPELLDYLSSRFIQEGWSVKKLVREIVLSHTYRTGSETSAQAHEIDPANHLLWRHSPRRLEAEEIRDGMLATAGRLEFGPPSNSAASHFKMIEINDNGPEARSATEEADRSCYRSVYLPLLRGMTPKSLEAFDPVTQSLVTGQRDSTTVPAQALYLLNSPFVRRQALALAQRVLSQDSLDDSARIRLAYQLSLGRVPGTAETARTKRFLSQYEEAYKESKSADQAALVTRAAFKQAGQTTAPETIAKVDRERTGETANEEAVLPKTAREAAWMGFAQALYGSAEFRFIQ